ncbi:FAD binding domain-containing protein [Limtongia smithiae]|uniref:FAD binding domain-containing protein n=1 Tax=Limtongia smithiae TaxID=1125753 RepID=UPI0034CD2FEB
MVKESNVDVLIVGAGPAGLMAANWFARTGVNYRIIDKRSSEIFAGQADGLQCRTLEVFQSFGFGDRALKEANHMLEISFWEPNADGGLYRSARIADSIPGISRFQQVVLHQGRIEAWFTDAIRKWTGGRGKVERPVLPVSLEIDESKVEDPSAYPVSVMLKTLSENASLPEQFGAKVANGLFRQFEGDQEKYYKDGPSEDGDLELVHAKYVLGCDGAHSWVRKQLGIEMEGESTDYVWGVLDSVPITDFPDIRNRCAIHSLDSGSIMVIPREQGLVRLYIQLRETPRDPNTKAATELDGNKGKEAQVLEKGRVDRSKITPEVILSNARKILHPYKLDITDVKWYTAYQIGQRVSPAFHKFNRVFISGDACHTHSPKAGQGMNVSMMDTFNLGWKIAHVLKGLATRDILATYESERLQVARDLIAFDHKFSRLFSGKPALPGAVSKGEGVSLDEFHAVFEKGNEFASGTIVDYNNSLLVDKASGQPAASADGTPVSISPLATKVLIGRRFDSAKVVNQSDAHPWHLCDRALSDGRWRIINFCGAFKTHVALNNELLWLGQYLASDASFIKKYTPPGAKVDSVIEVLTVHASKRVETEWDDFPLAFRPRDAIGRMDYWKIYADDESFHEGHGHAYEKYGIDPAVGAFVVLRPDGYVAQVEPLGADGVKNMAKFFDGFMIAQTMPSRRMDDEIETYGADSYGRPLLAV